MGKSVAVFCPRCGSASIAKSAAMGSAIDLGDSTSYLCGACKWEGPRSEVLAVPFTQGQGDDESIIRSMMGDLRTTLAQKFASAFLPFLLKWGFLSQPLDTKVVARYIAAVAAGILTSVLAERKKIAEEVTPDDN